MNLPTVPKWVWWAAGGTAAAGLLGYVGITYSGGKVSGITLLKKIDGVPISYWLASKFEPMRAAAAADGITLRLNSAFRSYAQQVALYAKSFLPGEPVAAKPGFSLHQAGFSVDVETGGTSTAIYRWLVSNAPRFGFKHTVKGEPWHLDYIGAA